MSNEGHTPIEDMSFFSKLETACDDLFELVSKWTPLAQDTLGRQLIRAFDSVGANLVEGDGRSTQPDSVRFFVIARASGRETRYWLKRASKRKLLTSPQSESLQEAIDHALRAINKLINYRRGLDSRFVRETSTLSYSAVLNDISVDS